MLRKLVTLAVTTGLAKKAWDAWRGNKAFAAGDRRGRDRPSAAAWRREQREAERRERG
jgi:hypothetical protein